MTDVEIQDVVDIKILGTGCALCDTLQREVFNALAELSLAANVDHITDIKRIAQFGPLGMPALLVNGKVVCAGSVPSRAKLKMLINEAIAGKR